MIFRTTTNYSAQTVKKQMEQKAKEVGFGVLGSYEFKKILKDKGFPITRDVTLFELCNPQAAQEALNAVPEISVYLPCMVSVYEEDGVTILSTIGVESIMENIENIDDEFKKHMQEIFDKIRALMNAW